MNDLTMFQMKGEHRVKQLVEATGLPPVERRALTAQMPHMTAPETAVVLKSDGVEIWLYSDEATFSTPNDDWRYERPDYATEDELLDAFISALGRALASMK